MKSILRHILCILLLLAAKDGTAQTHPVKFNLLSGTNGISIGKITGIARDMHGVMWFSDQSNQCLISYDGTSMTRYKHDAKNANSPGGTYPECLYVIHPAISGLAFMEWGLINLILNPINLHITAVSKMIREV